MFPMTDDGLRVYFAAHALEGLVSSSREIDFDTQKYDRERAYSHYQSLAEVSFDLAEAMLEECRRRERIREPPRMSVEEQIAEVLNGRR